MKVLQARPTPHRFRLIVFTALLLAVVAPSAAAQEASCASPLRLRLDGIGGLRSDFARLLELRGLAPTRPHLVGRTSAVRTIPVCPDGEELPLASLLEAEPERSTAWLDWWVQPAVSELGFNSAYPVDRNNGAVWGGRGWTAQLGAGAGARVGPLTVQVAPALIVQQNRAFDLVTVDIPGYQPWIYPWQPRKIDWPQRFGSEAFSTTDLGRTFARIDLGPLAAGASNENLWWGPARRNPLLLGNTAPGFPHAFVGTNRPMDIAIGTLVGEAFWGRLEESPYYDHDRANDVRLLAGIAVGYVPTWIRGLSLGAARMYATYPSDFTLRDYILEPYTDVRSNPIGEGNPFGDNQQLSVFARLAPPGSGFEAYGEWAREDHWETVTDLLNEPDHSQGYTLGFQHVLPVPVGWLRLEGELTYLVQSITFLTGRETPTFYAHPQVSQGHTHRGQLLAAPIGPGSDAQYLGLDWLAREGRIGLFVERVRWDEDAYYAYWVRRYGYKGHQVEITGGTRFARTWRQLDLTGTVAYGWRVNRQFLDLDQFDWEFRTDRNLRLELAVTGWPR